MSAELSTTTADLGPDRRPRTWVSPIRDIFAIAKRNLIAVRRVPQLMVFTLIQPVVFVVMFVYVFGGAINVPGESYVDYLMPGIFVQTVVFGSLISAIGMATDMKEGIVERFRSLPMSAIGVLAGRSVSDMVRAVLVVIVMALVGFAVGFRYSQGLPDFLLGLLVVLLFAYSLTWLFAIVGLAVKDPETAQAAAFPIMAPLVFASSVFVPVSSMPDWLQPFAENQPVSVTASSVRELMTGVPAGHPLWVPLAWIGGIVLVCVPLAWWLFKRAV